MTPYIIYIYFFWQLYSKGICGKLWRIMYRSYQGFECCVRIVGKLSGWYPMLCGIHQGGFLSLLKYTAFIDALLVELEHSGLCCSIHEVNSSPASYADDLAAATNSKRKTDRINDIVYNYGNEWRFGFNASKSSVLVFGETPREHALNASHRVFKLGPERVRESITYDHVGVKACIHSNNESRVQEKISKGRQALNASSGLGIRKNGLNMKSCNTIFWAVIVPILTFGCEICTLSEDDKENLHAFQRYAGRRIQRFPFRSPNSTAFYGLGWPRLTTYIMVKKLLFLRTILVMDPGSVIYRILKIRLESYSTVILKKKQPLILTEARYMTF